MRFNVWSARLASFALELESPLSRAMSSIALLTAVIIASIVVVAFARKKDAQPILSIEDFYGGLFIGFLSAYGGSALLQQVIGTEAGSG